MKRDTPLCRWHETSGEWGRGAVPHQVKDMSTASVSLVSPVWPAVQSAGFQMLPATPRAITFTSGVSKKLHKGPLTFLAGALRLFTTAVFYQMPFCFLNAGLHTPYSRITPHSLETLPLRNSHTHARGLQKAC